MKTTTLFLVCAAVLTCLTGCAEISEARTEALSKRIERQDRRIEERATRREMRASAEDRRYHNWYNRIMGRPEEY